jgi:transposase
MRDQVTPVPVRLEHLLPVDHLARLIWPAVERLDLAPFYGDLVVEEGGPGPGATDPQRLVALWWYATSQGVTSARALARLGVEHLAYIWLGGGVSMHDHPLSPCRVAPGAALEALMTEVLGRLIHAGLVAFEPHAQDGMRGRARAGAASFHRQPTLEQALAQARALVAALEHPRAPAAERPRPREHAARERAARERVTRLEAALVERPAVQAAKPADARQHARVSSTDPEARVMKRADGGYRPADTWELAVDTAHRVITGVEVVNVGRDKAQMPPRLDQGNARGERWPADWLMDGGFVSLPASDMGVAKGGRLLAPVPEPTDKARDRYAPRPGDSPTIAAWRARLGTDEAKTTDKRRAATAECVNAQARRQHGVQQGRGRGRAKVLCVAWWVALTHHVRLWVHHLTSPLTAPGRRA